MNSILAKCSEFKRFTHTPPSLHEHQWTAKVIHEWLTLTHTDGSTHRAKFTSVVGIWLQSPALYQCNINEIARITGEYYGVSIRLTDPVPVDGWIAFGVL